MKGLKIAILMSVCAGTIAYAAPPFQRTGPYIGGELVWRQFTPD